MANTTLTLRVRRSLGLTQREFAKKVGVHPMTISKWERGFMRPGTKRAQQIRLMERVMPCEEVKHSKG